MTAETMAPEKSNALAAAIASKRAANIKKQGRKTFIQTYRDNFAALIHDCFLWDKSRLTWGLAPYQQEALDLLQHGKRRRVAFIGPHGLGKSAFGALLVHAFILTREGEEEWKLPTTAGSYNQLTHFFWPEIRKWARIIDWSKVARQPYDPQNEMLKLNFKGKTGEAFAVAVAQKELIEGAHADQVLFIKDEAKAIPADIFDATEGAFSQAGIDGREAFDLAMSTPGDREGRLFDITTDREKFADWDVRMVTFEETVAARRNTHAWAEARARQWGKTSQVYINRVLGQYAPNDASGIIPAGWVQAAFDRWTERGTRLRPDDDTAPILRIRTLIGLGVDCADGGKDDSIIARLFRCGDPDKWEGYWSPALEYFDNEDLMSLTGHIVQYLKANRTARSIVDVNGVGAGVVSRLREQRVKVVAFNAANRWEGTDLSGELEFVNKRSRLWWWGREFLDPQNDHHVAICPDERLMAELTAPKYKIQSSGRVLVESKDDIRKRREGKSTDAADGWLQAIWDLIAEDDLAALGDVSAGLFQPLGQKENPYARSSPLPIRRG